MKKITLYLPLSDQSDILLEKMHTYCETNDILLEVFREEKVKPKMVFEFTDPDNQHLNTKQTFVSYKKIRQFVLNNQKTNQQDYFTDEFGQENWARKLKVDPDLLVRETFGKMILSQPVHLSDKNLQCLNYEKPPNERIYTVSDSDKPYRKFNGQYHRHCSSCPFEEGCIVCTLP